MHHAINEYQLRLDVQCFLWPGPLSCILGCNECVHSIGNHKGRPWGTNQNIITMCLFLLRVNIFCCHVRICTQECSYCQHAYHMALHWLAWLGKRVYLHSGNHLVLGYILSLIPRPSPPVQRRKVSSCVYHNQYIMWTPLVPSKVS